MSVPSTQPAAPRACAWRVVQPGSLPLRPDATVRPVEHRATVTLIWPADEAPVAANTLLVDPCFTRSGYRHAVEAMAVYGLAPHEVGRYVVTHRHFDHTLLLPPGAPPFRGQPFQPGQPGPLASIELYACPGHSDDLHAVVFASGSGQVWVVGDAILDEVWLRAWAYYWPNQYTPAEVVETWRTVARILSLADTMVPGHGDPFPVTASLIGQLLESFPSARYADRCPDVAETLAQRRAGLLQQKG